MVTTMYLVRHCEARGNVDREFHGSFDSDISENGKVQLLRLAERFRDIPLDAVYSSPLKRARLTAEAINTHHRLPIVFDSRLEELHGGKWELNKWADLPTLFPESSEAWGSRPHEFEAPEGETMRRLYDRMTQALCDIAAANVGKTVAVASHGTAIRNALCWGLTGDIVRLSDIPWCDNTAVSVFEFDGENVTVTNYNDSSHLDSETSTLEKQNWWRQDAPSVFE